MGVACALDEVEKRFQNQSIIKAIKGSSSFQLLISFLPISLLHQRKLSSVLTFGRAWEFRQGQRALCNKFLLYGLPSIPWPLGPYFQSTTQFWHREFRFFTLVKVETRTEGHNSEPSFSRPRVVPPPCVLLIIIPNAIFVVVLPSYIWILLIHFRSRFSKPLGLLTIFEIKACALKFSLTSTVRPSNPSNRQYFLSEIG